MASLLAGAEAEPDGKSSSAVRQLVLILVFSMLVGIGVRVAPSMGMCPPLQATEGLAFALPLAVCAENLAGCVHSGACRFLYHHSTTYAFLNLTKKCCEKPTANYVLHSVSASSMPKRNYLCLLDVGACLLLAGE